MRDVLFLTNFSDACFRATRAVAQLMDELGGQLTILHARAEKRESEAAIREKLHSFFPEADHFRGTRRVLAEGEVLEAIERDLRNDADYVIAPVPIRFGFPRIGHRSTRASLLLEYGTPVWTAGEKAANVKLGAPARNVACWFDAPSSDNHHLRRALDHAACVGARLHLIHVLPEMDEGTLTEPSSPLNEAEVAALVPFIARRNNTEIHVVAGGGRRALLDVLRAIDADVLFLNEHQAVRRTPFSVSMSAIVHQAPCPTICVGARKQARGIA